MAESNSHHPSISSIEDVISAARSLEDCSLDVTYPSLQRIVDSSKKFGLVAELWLNERNESASTNLLGDCDENDLKQYKNILNNSQSTILRLLMDSGVVHDSFQSSFQLSMDICYFLDEECEESNNIFGEQLASILRHCLHLIETLSLSAVISLRKVESLILIISSFFETYFGGRRVGRNIPAPNDSLLVITALLQRMKINMMTLGKKTVENGNIEPIEVLKEIRICYSDIRASCITTASSIIAACPGWVAEDTERYWRLCTLSLSTPLLFCVGYKASSQWTVRSTATTAATSPESAVTPDWVLTSRISIHLQGALKNISRYSSSAADDIMTAIRELCENSCTEVLFAQHGTTDKYTHIEHRRVDLLSALLQGYSSHPKKPSGRLTNEVPWKVAVTAGLTDMFRLINMKPSHKSLSNTVTEVDSNGNSADGVSCWDLGCHNLESRDFNEDFVHLVLEQSLLLYSATGIQTSPTEPVADRQDIKDIGKLNFGTTNTESLSNLLLSLTAGLIAFLELIAQTVCPTIGQDDTGDSAAGLQMEGHSCLRAPLSQLRDHLLFIKDRQAIFEDDRMQVSTEKELLEGIEQFLLRHCDVSESLEG